MKIAKLPRLSKLDVKILNALWTQGPLSIREIQESFPEENRPAYTTIQTTVYRLESKKALRRVRKIGKAHVFEAVVSQTVAQRRLLDELLGIFGGRGHLLVARLIEAGKLTADDVEEARKSLRKLSRKDTSS